SRGCDTQRLAVLAPRRRRQRPPTDLLTGAPSSRMISSAPVVRVPEFPDQGRPQATRRAATDTRGNRWARPREDRGASARGLLGAVPRRAGAGTIRVPVTPPR